MPAVAGRGSRRRTIAEMNMVPFIDVMLVLLIIFMVSAPLITPGVVDLPTVGKSKQQPQHVIEVVIAKDETMKLRLDNKENGTATMSNLRQRVVSLQGGDDNTPVVISADRSVKYELVVKTMDALQRAGVQRVGLAVKTTGV
ncbi:ExbD/TolR family protein [Piscinibacter gummiphilus]|uniref:Protein TolR n=1 Tax=Piscinibacter gummiphilus TaxID=946333 RepID=A0A1W6LCJ6_9BURK|nr:ExbD/TolR family protein [Piscinibacter gummiphilus]ARN21969.1 protein TolR [Piscinibacter gummiphilus]ATU66654.1 protein TolR [Piscinibacter gummiphilus]GLS94037.1 protein TolR [Piscinibacter gummiphilus]